MTPLEKIAPYYKAVAALLIALLTGLITGLVDGGLDTIEILSAVVAMLVAGGVVFAVPNRPYVDPSLTTVQKTTPQKKTVSPKTK
jgi:hypothetical protein